MFTSEAVISQRVEGPPTAIGTRGAVGVAEPLPHRGNFRRIDLPVITELVLRELQTRLRAGFLPSLPVPFYCTRDNDFSREMIA